MEQKTVTLNLSADVYERVRQKAEAANRPLETVAAESLSLLYGEMTVDMEEQLDHLPTYADSELWVVVYSHLSAPKTERLNMLTEQREQNNLSTAERNELDDLLQLIDRQMLLRSRALRLLKERGQDIEQYARGV